MSSLFSLLDLGAAALQAQNAGVAVASNNVANSTTAGYSRQRLDLQSRLAAPLVGGVMIGGIDRMSSSLLAGRIRSNVSSVSVADAFTGALQDLQMSMTSPGGELGSLMAGFFAGLSGVAASPADMNLRGAAVAAAHSLATGMREKSAAAEQGRVEANQRIRDNLQEANRLMQEIASANRAIAINDDPVLQDRREVAAGKLSEMVGGNARIDPDGQMRIALTGGEVLVDGNHAASFVSSPDAALGNMDRIEVVDGAHRRDVTTNIDGGRVGGELRARDQTIPRALAELDQLAFDVSTQVNLVHTQNAGLDGGTGRSLFAQPAGVTGAAAAMAVDPAVAADPSLLATAAPGAGPGDNQGALALMALRDQPLAAGGTRTFTDAGIDIVAGIGFDAARSAAERDFFSAQSDHLAGLRDSMSGVSLQEEMTHLSQFQHAAEAQVQFLTTIDELLGTIVQSL
jgi:flagellar hook-associated protein 1 FlgK